MTANNQLVFTYGAFTFTVANFVNIVRTPLVCDVPVNNQCRDKLDFDAVGVVTGGGFDPTAFLMTWSAAGTCTESTVTAGQCGSNVNASWQASISASGEPGFLVPEPQTTALLGIGLVLLGVALRRRA